MYLLFSSDRVLINPSHDNLTCKYRCYFAQFYWYISGDSGVVHDSFCIGRVVSRTELPGFDNQDILQEMQSLHQSALSELQLESRIPYYLLAWNFLNTYERVVYLGAKG